MEHLWSKSQSRYQRNEAAKNAMRLALEELESQLACRDRCGDPDAECVLQDACKPSSEHTAAREALKSALAVEPVSEPYTLPPAVEDVLAAAKAYEKWMGRWHDYTVSTGDKPAKQQRALIDAVRAYRATKGAA
jgi:hypothetical protein